MPADAQNALPMAGTPSGGEDLDSRRGVHDLVVGFYRELVFDDLLAPVFEEVAEVDWARHIPLLIDYWCRVLLGHDGYQGALLAAHRHVHRQEPLTAEHFDRWYSLWVAAVDAQWAGPYADKAKSHAAKIAATLAHRLPSIAWTPPDLNALPGDTVPPAVGGVSVGLSLMNASSRSIPSGRRPASRGEAGGG